MIFGMLAISMGSTTFDANPYGFAWVSNKHLSQMESSEMTFTVRFKEASTEFVPSWTGITKNSEKLKIMLRSSDESPWFSLGEWSLDGERTSINDQKNDYGAVYTDTFVTATPVTEIQVKLVAQGSARFSEFFMSSNPEQVETAVSPIQEQLPLTVPLKAQMSYPGGSVLCSPTAVSMVLSYWGSVLERTELNLDVPQVQKGVFDPAWPGTGNWPFNTAYAGSQPGMIGYVTRLRGLSDIVSWLDRKVPVACSVSNAMLKGASEPAVNDGHLVLVVGQTEQGDFIFNDPGRNVVRMVYRRDDFERAWSRSKMTAYLIYPKFWRTPQLGPWAESVSKGK